jgi:hypothetical protein
LLLLQGAFEGVNAVAFSADSKLVLAAENNKVGQWAALQRSTSAEHRLQHRVPFVPFV